MVRPTVSRCKSILSRCAVFFDRGNDSAAKMTLRVVVYVITIGLIKEHFSGDDGTRQIVDMVVLFLMSPALILVISAPAALNPNSNFCQARLTP